MSLRNWQASEKRINKKNGRIIFYSFRFGLEIYMPVKLIASDLDGTLMAPDHLTVTERTKEVLIKAHDAGCKIAIATGRTLGFIGNVLEQIPFCDYVIYSDGASVYDLKKKRDIYINHIPNSIAAETADMLEPMPLYYNMYVDGKVLTQNNKLEFYKGRNLPQEFIDYFLKASVSCDSIKDEVGRRDVEIIAIYSAGKDKALLEEYFRKNNLHITSSIPGEIEITAAGANKGTALKGLCEEEGISPADVIAFGDAANDCEMLEYAGYSFAMEDADDECKKSAKDITLSNAREGVAAALEKFFG